MNNVPELEQENQTKNVLTPRIRRTSIVPMPWGIFNPLARWIDDKNYQFDHREGIKAGDPSLDPIKSGKSMITDGPDGRGYWRFHAYFRRFLLLAFMFIQTAMATYFMMDVLPYKGHRLLEMAELALFALLFCWVSAGFWTALAGFWILITKKDKFLVSKNDTKDKVIDPSARTAIVMPICNEDVSRVLAGLRASYESIKRAGTLEHFDFFILSDSNQADICAQEFAGWKALCEEVGGFGKIFYRHRRYRVKRKSGNIDDFCRRWGSQYRYMIGFDADSVMTGECVSTLVRLMESHPGAGLIQTAPRASGRDTLYARIQQFSTRVYGPLFTAGLHFWQLGESHYWGHNAIIRLEPFMKHCALAPLPGNGPLSGNIMSHDFVEASLMRRAGWSVWIAYDLDGSYEEMPPNLLDELSRDRRWCQGNLMNFKLFMARGMHAVHRGVFVTGAMAYVSAPLWELFLVLSTILLATHSLFDTRYFVEPQQLFPIWPEWHPQQALALVTATATLLFLPKILSVVLILVQGAKNFGGAICLILSMLGEMIFSMLLAPVRMLFHTKFVIGAFLGLNTGWKSPNRDDNETTWDEAWERHGVHTVIGIVWGLIIYVLDPSFIWWALPITGSLAVSVFSSVLSSRVTWGNWSKKLHLFLIPEEVHQPQELKDTVKYLSESKLDTVRFENIVTDTTLCQMLLANMPAHKKVPAETQQRVDRLVNLAVEQGAVALTDAQKLFILERVFALSALHNKLLHSGNVHPSWIPYLKK